MGTLRAYEKGEEQGNSKTKLTGKGKGGRRIHMAPPHQIDKQSNDGGEKKSYGGNQGKHNREKKGRKNNVFRAPFD